MARYDTNGSLDMSFGTYGKVTTDLVDPSGDDSAEAVVIQGDGKIVAAGYYTNGPKRSFALARYTTNGSLDTSFGTSGVVTQAIGNTNDFGKAVALVGTSGIVVAGYSFNGTDGDFAVARFWQ
jgi:uncharacterized delta-60 repeat protein